MENPTTTTNGTTSSANPTEKAAPKPRDARLIHALLASQGVTAYQERVPLMLIDFAYRYTRATLTDAASLHVDGYGHTGPTTGRGAAAALEDINMSSLRMAVSQRQIAQAQTNLAKQDLLEMAQETNKVGLPRVERDFGVRLPEEKYLFTGSGYQLLDGWEEDEEEVDEDDDDVKAQRQLQQSQDDAMAQDGDEGGLFGDQDMEDEDQFEEVMGVSQDQKMGGT